jgi:hypothetical protein
LPIAIKIQGETLMKMKIGEVLRDSKSIESQLKEIE